MRFNLSALGCAVVFLLLLSVGVIRAHGPYDHSSQLVVGQTRLELVVTVGSDAARDFMTLAEQPANVVSSSVARELPAGLAARLFEITADGRPLVPGALKVSTEGLEIIFTATYVRPAAEKLELRALYFNGIEPMKRGAFQAFDEDLQPLGSAFLSRADNVTQIPLPALSKEPLAASVVIAAAQVINAPESPVAPQTSSTSSASRSLNPFVIVAVVAGALLLLGVCLRMRRSPVVAINHGKEL